MKISPLDIRNQVFRTAFRGADNEEVRVFLDLIATEYEGLIQENVSLTERLRHAEDRLSGYRSIEQSLRDGVLTAERLATDARESSKRESVLVIQDAELRAERILEDARGRLSRIAEEIRDLQTKRDIYAEQMRTFLVSHMEMLERNEQYLDGLDRVAEESTAAVSRSRRLEGRGITPPSQPRPRPEPRPELRPESQADTAAPESAAPLPPPMRRAPAPPQPGPGQPSTIARSVGAVRPAPRPVAPPSPSQPPPSSINEERRFEDESGVVSPARPISNPERSEGLFEITADDDDPPPHRVR